MANDYQYHYFCYMQGLGKIYHGGSNDLRARIKSHENDGKLFLAAMNVGGMNDETVQKDFPPSDNKPTKSCFYEKDLAPYIEWLVSHGYATTDLKEVNIMPPVDYEIWRYRKDRNPNVDRDGQALLDFGGSVSIRERIAKAAAQAEHLSLSDEWYTPPHIIEAARRSLEGIDTDPATCWQANRVVQAKTAYTKSIEPPDGGLSPNLPWKGSVWLNPPYGNLGPRFVKRLVEEYKTGHVTSAITCLNLNSAGEMWFRIVHENMSAHAICYGRVDFIKGDPAEKSSPSKGSIFAYFGPKPDLFTKEFGEFCWVYGALMNAGSQVKRLK